MKINILKKEAIHDRIDVGFYDKDYFNLISKLNAIAKKSNAQETARIENLLSKEEKDITGGATPLGATYLEEGIPFIRVQNVRKNHLSLKNLKYIPKFIHEGELKRSKLKPNDVLLTITGMTYGLSCVFPESIKEANMNQHSVRMRVDETKILPKFLSLFLNSDLGKMQSDRFVTGATRPALDYESVKSIIILFPKSLTKQERIVEESEKYLKKIKENYAIFREASNDCINLVSEKLKINITKHTTQYFVLKQPETRRLDCYYNSPAIKKILADLKKKVHDRKWALILGKDLNMVEDRIDFENNKEKIYKYIDIGDTDKEIGQITGYTEDVLIGLPSRARLVIKENDILIPRPIGSTEGIIIVPREFDGQLCSTGFIQIRPKNHEEATLLWGLLKSKILQEQFFYLQSGSLQPEITPKNFMNQVLIPIPNKKEKQELIEKFKIKLNLMKEIKQKIRESKVLVEESFKKSLFDAS